LGGAMTLAIIDLVLIITTIAGTVSAFSILYTKFIKPIKKVVKQVETNTENIKVLDEKIEKVKSERVEDNDFSVEVRAILLESLIAILDGLEQSGANHLVTEQKQKLIKFLSRQVGAKRKKGG
jgi:hypothetical protein